MKKALLIITTCLLAAGCSSNQVECLYNCKPTYPNHSGNISTGNVNNEQAMQALLAYLGVQVKKQWGDDEYLQAGKHRYVKYFDGYRTRAHIDFDNGKIYVSTVAQYAPEATLKKAIEETLLMPADPSQVDLFSDKSIPLNGKPFLLGQVKDHDNQDIQWPWRAGRFADYLIENKLHTKPLKRGTAYYVEIDMVSDHLEQREYQYADLIKRASRQYGISEDLIYAVVKTESSFNPFAVSHAGAYGLMQVIPKTAGADVFKLVKNKPGIPTKDYLFDPANNIDTGTAYLHILQTRYLRDVRNPTTKHYSMISAYNSGAGGVLSTFDSDRQRAMDKLNQLQPNQAYWALTNKHPKLEARRYLEKVLNFQKEFQNL
ncbi:MULTISPECIES: membrane-bound lytic murein transglycosylase MltC [unclassified Photobacterium]|uniref:membrane-bound lytic murein transglycosylase MltC n=1 Tax=unclassified Photobacterium TaxID=2628852 RepID=UPI000D1579FB|nr:MULTISPECIES: membrane-bound lytic murein transglycosylase MltC [unclassified Photobacterium]PSV27699.1 membrane-bound lytic murein transglycosylase MltC [Photobacterium sp. GB-56]PSV31395.1 membrane-bound lytic murein transglycosylase MltC [Photobacterium sp. GB-72]PSV45942.1 membrane-bound lytic murein transglycosylase MltC [Photobacterium sp. GB-36]PSV52353.1 membrane-bound lytic murein transglycosylase MltC [Photobacterium sp. GB-1]PSV52556.1 membrane-bound lytic murein transglycosylase